MLIVIKPGLQATLQGAARIGWRSWGIPYAGPADPLSMALANRLVGNASDAVAVEVTKGGFAAEFTTAATIAVTGADGGLHINGAAVPMHQTLRTRPGDRIELGRPVHGMRSYLAVDGGFTADTVFGSGSTYLPAQFGGYRGRALQPEDRLEWPAAADPILSATTPIDLQPVFTGDFAFRACASAETDQLSTDAQRRLFSCGFRAARQMTRMGFGLEGAVLDVESDGRMLSAAVYPGTVQCPPSGQPFMLGCDAQTTGGYPRIAQIARCDRHLIGQISPGDSVRFLFRTPEAAIEAYHQKQRLLENWVPDFALI